jgi:hypothetical protein
MDWLPAIVEWARAHSALVTAVGAVVAFLSWLVTNTISSRLAATRAALDRATTDDSLLQRLDRLRRGYREVSATLRRLDLMMSELNPTSIFSTFPKGSDQTEHLRHTYGLLQTVETAFFEHEDLQELLSAVDRLAGTQELPSSMRVTLAQATTDARATLTQFQGLLEDWDKKRRRSIELLQSGQQDHNLFQQATSQFLTDALPVHERLIAHRERLLPLHGRTLSLLVDRLNRLQRAHKISESASWPTSSSSTTRCTGCAAPMSGWPRSCRPARRSL